MKELLLFADAHVNGDPYTDAAGRKQRTRRGVGVGAWVVARGGGNSEFRPVLEEEQLAGANEDPNEAELRALFGALKAGWEWVQTQEAASWLEAVVVHIDNRVVKETMSGAKDPPELKELRDGTREFQLCFERVGVAVRYELVVCSFPGFKVAHDMCMRASRELLLPGPSPKASP